MTASTSQSSTQITPNCGLKTVEVTGTSATNGDTLTASELLVIHACIGFATDGTPGTYTITGTSNVITLQNGGNKTWRYICWGS